MRALFGDRGDFIALVANNEAAHLLPTLSRMMNDHVGTKVLPVPLRGEQMPEVRLSDHSPVWDAGYPAMMMSDTIETLDLSFLMAVIDGLELALGGWKSTGCRSPSCGTTARCGRLSAPGRAASCGDVRFMAAHNAERTGAISSRCRS